MNGPMLVNSSERENEIVFGSVVGNDGNAISEEESMEHVNKHGLIILRDGASDQTLSYDDRDQVLHTNKGKSRSTYWH